MRILRILVLSLLAIGVSSALAQPAVAQIFSTLHSFNSTDGARPWALTQDTKGNLYGTTVLGGAGNNAGTVFKITTSGTLMTLYSFCSQSGCPDGQNPTARLLQATDGNFYSTTIWGGANGLGTVFKMTPSGTLTTLHSFNGADGANPAAAGLIQATDGNFYGTTNGGGANGVGTVFKITPWGTLTTLHSFCSQSGCPDGSYPNARLVQATDGNFYGTTSGGGTNGAGTVFRITKRGTLTTLYSFCSQSGCADGAMTNEALVLARDGNFYGTTIYGGTIGVGTIFKMTPSGTLTTLHSFNRADGGNPHELIQARDGNFYGTASAGADNGVGTVFSITPNGTLTTLYSFCPQGGCPDGAYPGSLLQATDGNFYGTTSGGGASGVGTVFKIAKVKPLEPLMCSSLTDLGDFYLSVYESLGLSPQGSVVGTTLRWGQPYQGFEYNRGWVKRLPTLGGDSADPRQINAQGQIIGQSQLKSGLWHATRWDQGRPIDLGTLGGDGSFAGALNDRGDAAGNSNFHAIAWFNGKPVSLALDGEIQSYANGINNRGQVTGITNYSDGTWHSFIWKDGARTDLPRPWGDVFTSFINNKGTVCGGANFPTAFHAYTYHGKGLVDLDPTSQWWFSSCSGLNDNGHAVGAFSGQVGNRAFLWKNAEEGMINLNSMTPPDNRTSLFTAFNINEDDQITAAGYVDGQLHGFLLTPKMCSLRCVAAPSNLIAWWPGEGSAEDVMGGSAGVVQGVQFAPAAVRRGFVFDGFDDAIEVPDSPALHSITRQITFMAWINPEVPVAPDGSSGEYLGNLFSRRDPLVSEGISFQVRNDGALWTVLDTTNGGFWIGSWNPIKFDGNWKHLAMIVDTDAGRIAYYINGELLHEEYPDGLLGSQFRDVSHTYIGQRQGNDAGEGAYATMHYRGMMDEIQLFNRSLTSSEVKTIYQAGPKGVCKR